jgi:hypothetical protein
MIAFPEATIKETQIMVQKAGHDKCAPHHIKNLMQSEGIKRVRVRGNLYRYKVPQSLINAVEAMDSGVPMVNKSRIDKVWTPEMKTYPGNCRVVSL